MAEDEQDESQKTEDPTHKRLEDAFKKGQVAQSREVMSFFMLLALAAILLILGPGLMRDTSAMLSPYVLRPHDMTIDFNGFHNLMGNLLIDALVIMLIPMIVAFAAVFGGKMVQHRIAFSLDPMKPKLEKISVIKGLKRMFSLRSVVEFVKGIIKITVVGFIAFAAIWPFKDSIRMLPSMHVGDSLFYVSEMAERMLIGACAVMFFIAVLDFAYQKFEFLKKMRMSQKDIKDEHKDQEGDPHVKAKLRQLRAERARNRMMQSVPTADVVITNPTHFSVALKYEQGKMEAPMVVAKGADNIAFKIREIAKENDIPIVENPPLARALFDNAEIEQYIPYDYYQAAAEVISYVFRLKGKIRPQTPR